ncbi:MAG: hypothetical protein EXR46_10900 [Dehalococcoidia bacterium]|nr:hypothetical protein [Dehalococcoidia bacterium]
MPQNLLREAAIRLYRTGYPEGEIIRHKDRLAEIDKLGSAWDSLTRSSLNRWIKSAKEDDPDLEIWHLLNRRKWKPNVYTNWKCEGVIFLRPFYDPLSETMYLGPGQDYFPIGGKKPGNIVRVGKEKRQANPIGVRLGMNASDAVGQYVAELASLGYSLRDIVALWKGTKTRHPDMDKAPRVQWLAKQLRGTPARPIKPMSFSTIARILRVYSYGPVAESQKIAQMADEAKDAEDLDLARRMIAEEAQE